MRNLISRIITSLVLLPVVFLAFVFNGYYLALLLGVVSFLACYEASTIILPKNRLASLVMVLFWASLFFSMMFAFKFSFLLFAIPTIFLVNGIILFGTSLVVQEVEKITSLFYWCLYIVLSIGCVYWLAIDDSLGHRVGLSLIFLACISTWSNDTCAYVGGRIFGKHKLFEQVSQKKTWEGFFAGVLGTALIVGFCHYLPKWGGPDLFMGLTITDILWISAPSMVLAPLGDLTESRLKRLYHTKDSSNILPGHGGILDRIDGLLMVIPWTSLYAFIIRPLW